MKYKLYLFKMLLALVVTLSINLWAFTPYYLIVITALGVMQTSPGNTFYQGLKLTLGILIVVTLALVWFQNMELIYYAFSDIVIGAIIGISINIILPRNSVAEFKAQACSQIAASQCYFNQLMQALIHAQPDELTNTLFENTLVQSPLWVFTPGFDYGLRKSYQYFLNKIAQINDILFAMHYITKKNIATALCSELRPALQACLEQGNLFFRKIIDQINLDYIGQSDDLFAAEINALEAQFQYILPQSLEFLELNPEYLCWAEFIYYLKDLHEYLHRIDQTFQVAEFIPGKSPQDVN